MKLHVLLILRCTNDFYTALEQKKLNSTGLYLRSHTTVNLIYTSNHRRNTLGRTLCFLPIPKTKSLLKAWLVRESFSGKKKIHSGTTKLVLEQSQCKLKISRIIFMVALWSKAKSGITSRQVFNICYLHVCQDYIKQLVCYKWSL